MIFTEYQPIKGYFVPWVYGSAYIERLYLDFDIVS